MTLPFSQPALILVLALTLGMTGCATQATTPAALASEDALTHILFDYDADAFTAYSMRRNGLIDITFARDVPDGSMARSWMICTATRISAGCALRAQGPPAACSEVPPAVHAREPFYPLPIGGPQHRSGSGHAPGSSRAGIVASELDRLLNRG